jgi:RND family efflux transporter MFP subunit
MRVVQVRKGGRRGGLVLCVRVARAGEREVVVYLPEALVASARDSAASVSLWTSPDRKYAAKLRELAPSADPVTRTFLARFSISGAGDDMRLGMTATLTLSENGGAPVARVPISALFNQGAGPSLYVVNEGANGVTLKKVTVRSYGAQDVEITGGVAEGAQVVTLGVQKLDPSQKIRIVSSLAF